MRPVEYETEAPARLLRALHHYASPAHVQQARRFPAVQGHDLACRAPRVLHSPPPHPCRQPGPAQAGAVGGGGCAACAAGVDVEVGPRRRLRPGLVQVAARRGSPLRAYVDEERGDGQRLR